MKSKNSLSVLSAMLFTSLCCQADAGMSLSADAQQVIEEVKEFAPIAFFKRTASLRDGSEISQKVILVGEESKLERLWTRHPSIGSPVANILHLSGTRSNGMIALSAAEGALFLLPLASLALPSYSQFLDWSKQLSHLPGVELQVKNHPMIFRGFISLVMGSAAVDFFSGHFTKYLSGSRVVNEQGHNAAAKAEQALNEKLEEDRSKNEMFVVVPKKQFESTKQQLQALSYALQN